ncbi:hypothetical protein GCM10007047_33620 [Cerasicoccus arenae]|uniref:Uncharacterized protein n=1 Tax=Cerasicoccus arenae TaxID=424488 RepID=A0A8J3DFC8_9BACT|nr:hypothetical protein GCM10007047_33620 [Cerasicoccus arenae]
MDGSIDLKGIALPLVDSINLRPRHAEFSITSRSLSRLKDWERASNPNEIGHLFFQSENTGLKPIVPFKDVIDNQRKTARRKNRKRRVKIRHTNPMALSSFFLVRDYRPVKHVRKGIE